MFRGSVFSPPNATPLERVLADLAHARIDAVDLEVIRQVADPATCPVKYLAWLAAANSVDVWNHDWPEATKRAAIAAAPEVHRLKGTRKAVRLALTALGADASLVEWWEAEPEGPRGTFTVTVWSTGEGPELTVPYFAELRAAVRAAKPKSRIAFMLIGARVDGGVHIGGVPTAALNITVQDEESPAFRSVFVGGLAAVAHHIIIQPEAA